MKIPFGVIPFITFSGSAEEAVNFYISIFPDSKIESVEYFKEGERGVKGKVKTAVFRIMNNLLMAFDIEEFAKPAQSWQMSLYVNCKNEAMFDDIFAKLADGGVVLMGPEPVFNIRKAAWVTDKYGITWQIIFE
jgi:predicted 3-demethylubiquinone-9 3-methyltransferase (glyoxalase superfamily)